MAQKKKPGNQNPNPPPTDDDDDDDGGGDVSFTAQQREEITALVNAAVSGQLGRKLKGALAGALDEAIAPIREQLEAIGSRRQSDDGDDDGDDDDEPPQRKSKGKGSAVNPEMQKMKQKLDKLTAEREAEKAQAIAREKDATIREHLAKIGVDPLRMRGAAAVIAGSIKRDEKTGAFSYTAKRDGYDDDIDIEAGIKEWASTDEGKSYLAPPKGSQRPAGGSGMRPAGGGGGPVLGGGRPTSDPKAVKAEKRANAVNQLSDAIGALSGGNVSLG
jgi:hypothetical protein